jgi:putative ABC transport system permease protein
MHSIRFLKRHRGYVAVNLIGFATGLAACLVMVSFLRYQSGFDSFQKRGDRIYRGVAVIQMAGRENTTIHLPGLLGEQAIQKVPGIESAVRFNSDLRYEIMIGEKKFTDQKVFYVDSTFFRVFSFPLLSGNPKDVLVAPFSIVLTRHAAQRLFGRADPVGESLRISGVPYQVTGIMEDPPGNSHLTFDLLASMTSLIRPDYNIVESQGFTFPTYFLLREGADPATVLGQLNRIFDEVVEQRYGKAGITGDLQFQPLSAIHTTQLKATDYAVTTPKSTLILFLAMAVFILVVAVINFVNLTTALYERRSREIGIKKVLGATRSQLFWQTLVETAVLVAGSLVISLIISQLVKRWAESLWAIELPLFYESDVMGLLYLVGGAILIIFISSFYPNWYLSRMNPGVILKIESISRPQKFSLAKILVLVQYGLAVFIICLMFLFSAQLKFISKADLGFDPKGVVVFEKLTNELVMGYPYLKEKLLQIPSVESVTASYSIPGKNRSNNSVVYRYGSPASSGILINVNVVQHDYLETYGIRLVEGEGFSRLHTLDSLSFLINQEAASKLGLDHPVGEELVLRGLKGKVIGVFQDFRSRPVYSDYDKEILTMQTYWFNFISIRMKPGFTPRDLKEVERVFQATDPGYQPVSFFIDDLYHEFYQREENQVKLIFSAAIVGIVLSLMGLISLMVLTLTKQRREMGIRKVFGANAGEIFYLLVNRMIRWVVYSNLLAWPLAYMISRNWLDRFAYRIELLHQWPLFLLAGAIVVFLTFIAISIQTPSVARMSPAEVIQKG